MCYSIISLTDYVIPCHHFCSALIRVLRRRKHITRTSIRRGMCLVDLALDFVLFFVLSCFMLAQHWSCCSNELEYEEMSAMIEEDEVIRKFNFYRTVNNEEHVEQSNDP